MYCYSCTKGWHVNYTSRKASIYKILGSYPAGRFWGRPLSIVGLKGGLGSMEADGGHAIAPSKDKEVGGVSSLNWKVKVL